MPRRLGSGLNFERLLADAFRRARWRVHLRPRLGELRPDLVAELEGKKYIVELKQVSEGRGDRLIPLLAQAVLQAQTMARHVAGGAVPVAVVAAEYVPTSVAEQIKRFGAEFASDAGVGVIDSHGLRAFAGQGLEMLDAEPSRLAQSQRRASKPLPNLFSDLNSWMLKILLGQSLPEALLAVPRAQLLNAAQLARAAGVSGMSAARFVQRLRSENFLDDSRGRLAIARAGDLLARWAGANQHAVRDVPARWIIRREENQIWEAMRAWASNSGVVPRSGAAPQPNANAKLLPRCAIGLFAAADALGLGFVHGVPPYVYLERMNIDAIRRFGLSTESVDRRVDVFIRIPANPESVFRAAVVRDGVPVTDVLQVWLDAAVHPARGQAQADEIRRRALGPIFGRP